MKKKYSSNKRKIKARRYWNINPGTKVKESEKRYRRRKLKKGLKDILKDFI